VIVEANQRPQKYYRRAELDAECFFTPGVLFVPELPKAMAVINYQGGEDTFNGSVHQASDGLHCQDMDPKTLENYYPSAAPEYNRTITLQMRFGKSKENNLRGRWQLYYHSGRHGRSKLAHIFFFARVYQQRHIQQSC
jgi:hypothetical protein